MSSGFIPLKCLEQTMKETTRHRTVVLLNADYTILHFIPMKRAMNLFVSGKIDIEETHGNKIIHPKLGVGFPSIVRMKDYIYVPYNKRRLAPKKKRILTRDNWRCQYCDKALTKLNGTIDHVVPKANPKYPGHIWTNVVACCGSCNNRKGARTPEEAGMKLARTPFAPNLQDLVFGDKPNLMNKISELKSK